MKHYNISEYIDPTENINIYSYEVEEPEPPHTHEFIEIVYILAGQGKHSVNGIWYPVTRGDLLFLTPGQIHSFVNQQGMELVNCLVSPDFFNQIIHESNAVQVLSLSSMEETGTYTEKLIPVVRFSGHEILAVEALIKDMIAEFSEKRIYYKSTLQGYLLVLISRIFRALEENSTVTLDQMGKLTPELLVYIEENLNRPLSLQELARKCFYSPAYFSKIFKEYCGMSLTEYLAEKRMQLAESYLLSENWSVEEVCRAVGYNDRSQFYKLFRSHTGMSPGEYRTKMRKK
ncbi:MAG: AraC family transcriptional regulator [Caldicoprobacterales bacterium]|jgi:AraC family L-rhamnose operon transcriptional activator RhaR|nr:AraC family transcriptional regulator [Clostridiales bacterium]